MTFLEDQETTLLESWRKVKDSIQQWDRDVIWILEFKHFTNQQLNTNLQESI